MEDNTQPNPEPIELPTDLQASVEPPVRPAPTPASIPPISVSPAESVATSSVSAPSELESQPSPVQPILARRTHGWGWLGISLAVILLVGATVYFILSQIGFNRGKLQLTFEPAGVDLVIDQKLQKKSVNTLTISLKAGDHTIQVSKDGYLDWEQTFSLAARETAQMQITLDPIPNMELVAELPMAFPVLISRDTLLAFFDAAAGEFKAVELSTKNIISLFGLHLPNLQKVSWSPSRVAAIVKLPNVWKLANMFDNRRVKGQYVQLGQNPEQGPTFNNGVATWLLDSERRTNAGLQPVLLNENVRDVIFSADGSQIIYFYEAADGEKSLIRAENIDGSNWTRLATEVDAVNPTLQWVNDDRHILLIDDTGKPDKLFDLVSKESSNVMPDRMPATPVASSPDGSRILYLANTTPGPKLTVWNVMDQKAEKAFDQSVTSFAWTANDTIIVATSDNNLWHGNLNGQTKPVKFTSSFGVLQPKQLIYSRLLQRLFIFDGSRVFSITV